MADLITNGLFQKPSLQTLESEALELVREQFGADVSTGQEDFLGMFYRLIARLAFRQIERLEETYYSFFLRTATNSQLDDLLLRNNRLLAQAAFGNIELTWDAGHSDNISVTILPGRKFRRVTDGALFSAITSTSVSITNSRGGSRDVLVRADEVGVAGNTPTGVSFEFVQPPDGVQNPNSIVSDLLTGGTERESDADYRERAIRLSQGFLPDRVLDEINRLPSVTHSAFFINTGNSNDSFNVPARGYEIVLRVEPNTTAEYDRAANAISNVLEPHVPAKRVAVDSETIIQRSVEARNGASYNYYFTLAEPASSTTVRYTLVVSATEYLDEYDDIIRHRVIEYLGGIFTPTIGSPIRYSGDNFVGVGGQVTLPRLQGLLFELETSERVRGIYRIASVSINIEGNNVTGSNSTYTLNRYKFLDVRNTDIRIAKTVLNTPPSP